MIFIVTVRKGKLYLGGKIIVGRVCGQREAEQALPYEPYEAEEHILAAGTPDRFRKDNVLPTAIVARLTFESKEGPTTLKFKSPGILDQQTLRGVRRLTEESGQRLEALLRK